MMEMHCPGHFGHIELPVPVYNPLIFAELLSLIKLVCFNCHHFRMEMAKVRLMCLCFRCLFLVASHDFSVLQF